MSGAYLALQAVSKAYPGVQPLKHITFSIPAGTFCALLGENGAGKTTLLRILAGLEKADGGSIRIGGKEAAPWGPKAAAALGIGMVHGHHGLVPDMTVLTNALLAAPGKGKEKSRKRIREKLRGICEAYGMDLPDDQQARQLTPFQRLQGEVAILLCRDVKLLLVDEPGALITPQEMDRLTKILRKLTKDGVTVLMTARWVEDALAADQCIVLRDGECGAPVNVAKCAPDALRALLGHEGAAEKRAMTPGGVVLEVRNASARTARGRTRAFRGVSFEVRAGEGVCLTGLEGMGLNEFAQALTGVLPMDGRIRLQGREIQQSSPRQRAQLGLGRLMGDDWLQGQDAQGLSLADEMLLGRQWEKEFADSGLKRTAEVIDYTQEMLEAAGGKDAWTPGTPLRLLPRSAIRRGAMAREMDRDAPLLLALEPTKGLREADAAWLRARLMELRSRHRALLVITTDAQEALQLGDRVLVMRAGEIVGEFEAGMTDVRELGLYMTGTLKQEKYGGFLEEEAEE